MNGTQKSKRWLAALAALMLISAAARLAMAQGKGTGNVAGSIYFINAEFGSPTNNMWSMTSSGTNTTFFGWYGYFQHPSRALHGGHRFFITIRQTPGLYYADGVTVRSEVFAYRDDFNSTTNNNPLTRIQLTNDPNQQPLWSWFNGMHWLSGDATITYVARPWVGATPGDMGLYKADVAYGQDGLLTSLVSQPVDPLMTFLPGEFSAHSFSPDGTKVVYRDGAATGLWIANLATNTRTKIYSGAALYPDYSPLGDRIVFAEGGSIKTIKIDGSGVKEILYPYFKWSGFGHPYYSPDGSSVICAGTINGGNGNSELVRVKSGGGSLTNVSNTLETGEVPIAWRN